MLGFEPGFDPSYHQRGGGGGVFEPGYETSRGVRPGLSPGLSPGLKPAPVTTPGTGRAWQILLTTS